jgi:hypothetical protein
MRYEPERPDLPELPPEVPPIEPPPEIPPPIGPPVEEPPAEEAPAAPGPSLAEQLVTATGVGGSGFQRPGTPGAAPFRTPDFYRGRSTAAPETIQRLGAGAPTVAGGVGQYDEAARSLRAGRLLSRFGR